MALKVVLTERAVDRLDEIGEYIAHEAGFAIADRYIDRIHAACSALTHFPRRGRRRDDLSPGLRTIAFERRVMIAYRVLDTHVEIVSIAYGGRDLAGEFRDP